MGEIGRETMRVVESLFPTEGLELTVEPGRALVGDAAMLVATVIGQATRGKERWLYLDAGVFNALLEAIQGFRYQIRTERTGPPRHYVLAGPSCDSVDTIATDVSLPGAERGRPGLLPERGRVHAVVCVELQRLRAAARASPSTTRARASGRSGRRRRWWVRGGNLTAPAPFPARRGSRL